MKRLIIVIPAAKQADLNAYVKANYDALGGEFTFTVGLSPDGNEPITHYWCGFPARPEIYDQIMDDLDSPIGDGVVVYEDKSPEFVLDDMGLKRKEVEI